MTPRPVPVRDAILAALTEGPLTSAEMAARTGYRRNSTDKALRWLSLHGRVRADSERRYPRHTATVWALYVKKPLAGQHQDGSHG